MWASRPGRWASPCLLCVYNVFFFFFELCVCVWGKEPVSIFFFFLGGVVVVQHAAMRGCVCVCVCGKEPISFILCTNCTLVCTHSIVKREALPLFARKALN